MGSFKIVCTIFEWKIGINFNNHFVEETIFEICSINCNFEWFFTIRINVVVNNIPFPNQLLNFVHFSSTLVFPNAIPFQWFKGSKILARKREHLSIIINNIIYESKKRFALALFEVTAKTMKTERP